MRTLEDENAELKRASQGIISGNFFNRARIKSEFTNTHRTVDDTILPDHK